MPDLPPWLQVLYPFAGRAFATPEGCIRYVDTGEGPPVVFLHGNPTWSFFYRDLIIGLRGDHRCLAPDHLGCGLSDKPQRAEYTLAGHIRRTRAWLESLSLTQRFHLVVHDWGGAIGFGAAHPFRDQISGVTVLNTAAFPFPSIPFRIALCRWPFLGTFLVRGANAFVRAATRTTTVQPLSEAVAAGYRYPYGSWADRVAVAAFVRDIPMRRSHPSWSTLMAVEQSLPDWPADRLAIIWGMQDWCFHPRILAEWQRRFPSAAVHRLDRAGHYLLEDAGEAVADLVRRQPGFEGAGSRP